MTKEQILKIIVPEGSIPLQTEIDKAEDILELISQEKEKWVKQLEELKNKEQDWNNNWERNGYEIGINAVINLLQNK